MKKPIPKFKGSITMGLFIPFNQEEWRRHVATLEGNEVEVVCKKYRAYKSRSNEQNSYYWSVIVRILSDDLGYTDEEVHEILKFKFLTDVREYVFEREGQKETKLFNVPLTTTNLTTQRFEDYLSNIRTWASRELSIYIPQPNETNFDY